MITLLLAFVLSGNIMALEISSSTITSITSSVDMGPTSYKNFSCANYYMQLGHACEWQNRKTKEKFRIIGQQASDLLDTLVDNGATIKCTYSPWGDVCDAYYYSVVCDDNTCTLKTL